MADSPFNRIELGPSLAPESAAAELRPIAERLFTPRLLRYIDFVNIGSLTRIDPPAGPAILGFFRKLVPGTLETDTQKPAQLIGAQRTRDTGLVTVDLHTVSRLDSPEGPCSDDHCGRLLYGEDGSLEVQQPDGTPVDLDDPSLAVTALRWALRRLDVGGLAYDPCNNPVMGDRDSAAKIIEAGHTITLPDAVHIKHGLGFPYPVD